jgi:hypothetical protein
VAEIHPNSQGERNPATTVAIMVSPANKKNSGEPKKSFLMPQKSFLMLQKSHQFVSNASKLKPRGKVNPFGDFIILKPKEKKNADETQP